MNFRGFFNNLNNFVLVAHATGPSSFWDDWVRRGFEHALVYMRVTNVSAQGFAGLRLIFAETIKQIWISGSSAPWSNTLSAYANHYISNLDLYGFIYILSSPIKANNCLCFARDPEEFEGSLLFLSSSILFNYYFDFIIRKLCQYIQ